MKKLLLVPLFFMLTGCAPLLTKLYESYFLAPYDNIEYALVNKIRTMAYLAEPNCSNKKQVQSDLEGMYFISVEVKNFAQHLPDNKDSIKLTTDLSTLVKGAYDHYEKNEKVGEAYCKAKMKQIYSNAETIQKAIGAKPR